MNISADWAMVIITGVYVIATIAICYFNYKSAKATREQVAESKRQFDATNRPYVTCDYIYERRLWHGIRIKNHGTQVATNVKISVNSEFVQSLQETHLKYNFERIGELEHTIGIGQKYDFFFGTRNEFKATDGNYLSVKISYYDRYNKYEDEFYFPFQKYGPLYSVETFEDDIKNFSKNKIKL